MTVKIVLFAVFQCCIWTLVQSHSRVLLREPRNALSKSAMTELIQTENPQNYPLVECMINELILIVQTRPDWGPLGQQRFMELVGDRYFDGAALFRAIDQFLVQFGLASSKAMRDKWSGKEIKDDPHIDVPFTRGIMSFAGSGPNSRGTQMFFTLAERSDHLGKADWEVPFGRVIYGDEALKSINKEYGDDVSQGKIWQQGYEYLQEEFPDLSYIQYCRALTEREMDYYRVPQHQEHDLLGQIYDFETEEGGNLILIASAVVLAVIGVAVLAYFGWKKMNRSAIKLH